jgi:ferredoxin
MVTFDHQGISDLCTHDASLPHPSSDGSASGDRAQRHRDPATHHSAAMPSGRWALVSARTPVHPGTVERASVVFGDAGLQALIDVLIEDDRDVLGPVVEDGAIAVGPIESITQLPAGWYDAQSPGRYHLDHDGRPGRFRWTVGPQTWKAELHPASVATMTLTQHRPSDAVHVELRTHHRRSRALLGLRACEVAAVERLDRVLLDAHEPVYRQLRDDLFVVAVNCTTSADTCFCAAMSTGPAVGGAGFDIQLTEIVSQGRASYVAAAGTRRGSQVLDAVAQRADVRPAAPQDLSTVEASIAAVAEAQTRSVETSRLPGGLASRATATEWSVVADTCLACGNCTAVCPTCFCTSIEEAVDLDGTVDRSRVWDTCFSLEFSRAGDHPIRESTSSRYRQWLTHKFDTWHTQFGSSGCVGCGRCITWCPVGIDVTEALDTLLHASADAP